MSRAARIRDQFAPWAGLVIGIAAGAFAHQFGSDTVFDHCASASPLPLFVILLLCMALTALGGLLSWRIGASRNEGPTRRLVAFISAGISALIIFAIFFTVIAALVLPRCFQ